MGLLQTLFGSSCSLEARLEREYVATYSSVIGLSREESTKLVRTMLAQVRSEIGQFAHQPRCLSGDELLAAEKTSVHVRAALAARRAEGVTDQDILWWHNMSELEKGMILKEDAYYHMVFAIAKVDQGMSEDEAEKLLPAYFPIYGDPDNPLGLEGDDRPLPIELRDRVNRYLIAQHITDSAGLEQQKKRGSSMNAFIRRQITADSVGWLVYTCTSF